MSFSKVGFTTILLVVAPALVAATDLQSVNLNPVPESKGRSDLHITPKHVSHGEQQCQRLAKPEAVSNLRSSPKARDRARAPPPVQWQKMWVPGLTESLSDNKVEQFAQAEKVKLLRGSGAGVPENAMRYSVLQRK